MKVINEKTFERRGDQWILTSEETDEATALYGYAHAMQLVFVEENPLYKYVGISERDFTTGTRTVTFTGCDRANGPERHMYTYDVKII